MLNLRPCQPSLICKPLTPLLVLTEVSSRPQVASCIWLSRWTLICGMCKSSSTTKRTGEPTCKAPVF